MQLIDEKRIPDNLVGYFVDAVNDKPKADWDDLELFIMNLELTSNLNRLYFKKRIQVWKFYTEFDMNVR